MYAEARKPEGSDGLCGGDFNLQKKGNKA